MLRIGCDLVELPIGVLSRIEDGPYVVVDVVHPDNALAAGCLFNLQDTCGANTLAAGGPIACHDVSRHEIRDQAYYATFGLESYIDSPVWVDTELYARCVCPAQRHGGRSRRSTCNSPVSSHNGSATGDYPRAGRSISGLGHICCLPGHAVVSRRPVPARRLNECVAIRVADEKAALACVSSVGGTRMHYE